MSLIEKIYEATQSGYITSPFTTEQIKTWVVSAAIVKNDGSEYAEASIDAILSNSDVANIPTTNKNKKVLMSQIGTTGKKEYWFSA